MRAVIIGADEDDAILAEAARLSALGVTCIQRWCPSPPNGQGSELPVDTRVVVLLCDRLNRRQLRHIRQQTAVLGIRVIYCRHSVVDLREKLGRLVGQGGEEGNMRQKDSRMIVSEILLRRGPPLVKRRLASP